jgi:hypothetical protein
LLRLVGVFIIYINDAQSNKYQIYGDVRMGHSANHSILALCITTDLFGTSYRAYL